MRGPRAQQDRELYRRAVQRLLAGVRGLEIADGCVTDLVLEAGGGGGARAVGVVLSTGGQPGPLPAEPLSIYMELGPICRCNITSLKASGLAAQAAEAPAKGGKSVGPRNLSELLLAPQASGWAAPAWC